MATKAQRRNPPSSRTFAFPSLISPISYPPQRLTCANPAWWVHGEFETLRSRIIPFPFRVAESSLCTSFGHAGDGNFHCILPLKKNDTNEYRDRVTAIIENMTMRAISVGGTCTGEHGIGYGKKRYLARMHGEGGLSMMETLKRSIDPWNIMNPGKIVSNDFYGGHVVIKK